MKLLEGDGCGRISRQGLQGLGLESGPLAEDPSARLTQHMLLSLPLIALS